jgi:putative transcriptional regulator
MKKNGITQVTRKPGYPFRDTGTDWEALAALSQAEIHAAAVGDPDAQPLPRDMRGLTKLVNVKRLRERLGLTQGAFAAVYGIPLGTLRDWEQRRKHPDAPARAYLQVIERSPEAVAVLRRASGLGRAFLATPSRAARPRTPGR